VSSSGTRLGRNGLALTSAVVAVSLAACSSSKPSATTSSASTAASASSAVPSAAGSGSAASTAPAQASGPAATAPAATGGTLTIGVIYPFTGANADQGATGMAGCLSGVAQVNAAGGVLNHNLTCKPYDTKGDPADAVPAANQMMASGKPVMVVGASDDAVATSPIVTASKVPNFATIGDPHFDNQTNPYFYRLTPSDALQGIALGYYAAKNGYLKAAAVFTSDLGAQTSVPPLRTEYKRLGGTLVNDTTLAPGSTSYRSEVAKVIASKPDAIISEMDPQSAATFWSEYAQLAGKLPIVLGTERTSNSDWIQAVDKAVSDAAFVPAFKAIAPYVEFSGPGYDLYKQSLGNLGGQVRDANQYVGHPYAISDFDAVAITALAMTMANSSKGSDYNADIAKVTAQSAGATVVHTYAEGIAALKAGKTIQYVGASGPLVFDKYNSAGRAFAYFEYDPASKSMISKAVIPGTALEG
jgi:ABC-type branched-subunit amino acid transport system substrate-binding protein